MTEITNSPATLRAFQEETVNQVLTQVTEYQKDGVLDLPKDYSPANALKAAWFKLLQLTDRDNKPVLEVCSKTSIANALMQMVTEGLSVSKNQCAFIAYGNTLTMQREYFGSMALAKRYNPEIKWITANVVYHGDEFEYGIDTQTGMKKILKHTQKLENINNDKILGAYATIVFHDESIEVEVMTMSQIQKAWMQGATKGNSPAHKNFADQMCKKTVISRICKPYINASDDATVVNQKDVNTSETIDIEAVEIKGKPAAPKLQYAVKEESHTAPESEPAPEYKKEAVKANVPSELNF
jgi:recombination protein RecT